MTAHPGHPILKVRGLSNLQGESLGRSTAGFPWAGLISDLHICSNLKPNKISQRFWDFEEVPAAWKIAVLFPFRKRGVREDPVNYRLVRLTSVPGKIMEVMLDAIEKHLGNNVIIIDSFR